MLKDSLKILSGNLVSSVFTVARTFLIAHALGPADYGIFNLFTVVLSYSLWFECGILSGMDKMILLLRGRCDQSGVKKTRDVAFTVFLALYCFIAALLFCASFVPFFYAVGSGIRLLSFVILLSAMQNFYLTVLRAEKRFSVIAWTNVITAVSMIAFLLIGYRTEYSRLLVTLFSFLGAYLVSFVFCMLRSGLSFTKEIDWRRFKTIIRTGFPMVVIGALFAVFITMDRWFIAKHLSRDDLGNYAFSVSVSNFVFGLSTVFAYVFYPRARELFGAHNDPKRVKDAFSQSMNVVCNFAAMTSIALIIFLPFFYKTFFLKYSGGMTAANFVIIGYYFLSVSSLAANLLVAIDKQKYIFLFQLCAAAVLITCNYLSLRFTRDIRAVALAVLSVYAFYSIGMVFYSFRCMGRAFYANVTSVLKFHLPLFSGLLIVQTLQFVDKSLLHFPGIISPALFFMMLIIFFFSLFLFKTKDKNDLPFWRRLVLGAQY